MSPEFITAALAGSGLLVASLANTYIQLRNANEARQQAREARERDLSANIQRTELASALKEVHTSTNGLAARNEQIAEKLGIQKGIASEKLNHPPADGSPVPEAAP